MPIPAQVTRTEQVPNNEKTVEDQRKYYLQEAVKLFELVKTNGSADLLQQASYYEAYSMLMLGQAEDILGVLGNKTPVFLPVESLIAAAQTNGRWLSRRNCSSKCHLSICHSFTQSVD